MRSFLTPALHKLVASLLTGVLISFSATGNSDLPDLGDESAAVMSPYEEQRLGEAYMQQARQQMNFISDPELLDYIDRLGQRLAKHSDQPDQSFRFFLVSDSSINAFAVPGGYITLHSGLITSAENENELAAVIAHEIAHITQRHIPRLLAAKQKSALPSMAALLAAIVLLNSGNIEGGQAAVALSTAGVIQREINFTRHHEEEADRVGTRILADAGIDPRAMPDFFKRLVSWGRLYNTNLPEFLQTHPLSTRRLTESENRAETYPRQVATPSADFHHAKARLRALVTSQAPEETVKYFQSSLEDKKYQFEQAERYGHALALGRAGRYEASIKELNQLLAKPAYAKHHKLYQRALANAYAASGQQAKANTQFQQLLNKQPDDQATLISFATILLKARQHEKAYEILRKSVRIDNQNPEIQRMLATAAGETGRTIESHRAMAEYYFMSGVPSMALEQLKIAKRFAKDNPYHLAAIEARTVTVNETLKQASR